MVLGEKVQSGVQFGVGVLAVLLISLAWYGAYRKYKEDSDWAPAIILIPILYIGSVALMALGLCGLLAPEYYVLHDLISHLK